MKPEGGKGSREVKRSMKEWRKKGERKVCDVCLEAAEERGETPTMWITQKGRERVSTRAEAARDE